MHQFSQYDIFNFKCALKAPNISQVPKYSPFRFPGGKTWFYPFAKAWMQKQKNKFLVEAFAGGASIGLASVIENWVSKLILVEIDPQIVSVWQAIVDGNALELAKLLLSFELNDQNLEKQFNIENPNNIQMAFSTLLKNRINHGGILASGSGKLKYGEGGKGILSRWYPKTLSHRLHLIHNYANRITLIQDDAIAAIEKLSIDKSNIFFIDPPYTIAGKRLYDYYNIDHEKLFQTISNISSSFILTYDESPFIINLARKYNMPFEKILMTTTHHREKYELIISDNLDWL